jgi:group I intron endonuclease
MPESYIYKITNKFNNKIYIGRSKDPFSRFKKHIAVANSNPKKGFNAIHGAIKKYGKENFIYEIIETCNVEDSGDREIYWIAYFKSNEKQFGYNLTIGGDGVVGLNEENKLKLIKSMTGRKHSEAHKKKISESGLKRNFHHSKENMKKFSEDKLGEKNPMYGKTASPEARLKQSEFQSSRERTPLTKEHINILKEHRKNQDMSFRIPIEIKQEIISLYKTNNYTKRQLSEKFNLKFNTVVKIIRVAKG